MQDNKILEEITSLFTKSTKASGLIIDKVSGISLPKVQEDIRTVHSRGPLIKLLILLKLMSIPNIHKLRSEEHTSELQSRGHLVCRLLLEKQTTKVPTYEPN